MLADIQRLDGVFGWKVLSVRNPVQQDPTQNEFYLSYSQPLPLVSVANGTAKLGTALEVGGVDKLHRFGIKGKGIEIGIIDTGDDYRHPALGAGFCPGHKIVGGYSFFCDSGTLGDGSDPLTSCYMLSATYQEEAGLLNGFDAIYADDIISPEQWKISDNSKMT